MYTKLQPHEALQQRMLGLLITLILVVQPSATLTQEISPDQAAFRAAVAKSVITPQIGSSINGGMRDRITTNIHDETYAKAMVLDDGKTKLAIVVSDLCMIYRETLDQAKQRAHKYTGIGVDHMMASATHTHSAGTACSVFQSDPDPEYLAFLSVRIADAIIRAHNNLAPARIAYGRGSEPSQVFNRRWKMKPGKASKNPFGGVDQVRMNPGHQNPDVEKPAGPIDPEIPVVCVQSLDGTPIGLLANYSLHYVGGTNGPEISADYYGLFSERLADLLGTEDAKYPFLAFMSNGTSGDINNIDYSRGPSMHSKPYAKMNEVANVVAAEVYKVYQNLVFQPWVPLHAAQKEITLAVRLPTEQEVIKAKEIVAAAEGPIMQTREEIYARETILISEYPKQIDLILQAFKIGNLGIAAIPCEVFVEIGLDIKAKSPFSQTFTISLANGYNGYLPTPKDHAWGGYETWRARSSYLEVGASEKISETILALLDDLYDPRSPGAPVPTLTGQKEPTKLFNEKNLDGWYVFIKNRGKDIDPKNVFTVQNGMIRISGEEYGCITTESEYENYRLELEYKWGDETFEPRVDRARDNGVLIHSQGEDGGYNGTWMHSIECQIIEGGTGDFLVVGDGSDRFAITSNVADNKHGSSYVYDPNGKLVTIHKGRINWYGRDPNWKDELNFRGRQDLEKPVGEWNRMVCDARGGDISVYLNGHLVNHTTDATPQSGKIQIQSEGAEMFVRKVVLTPLD